MDTLTRSITWAKVKCLCGHQRNIHRNYTGGCITLSCLEHYHCVKFAAKLSYEEPHIIVRKNTSEYASQFHQMWVGKCTCGYTWQYWYYGAALGHGLEHIRQDVANASTDVQY